MRALGLDRDIPLPLVDVGDLHEVRSPLLGKPFVLPHGLERRTESGPLSSAFRTKPKGSRNNFERIRAVRDAIAMIEARHQHDRSWWLRKAPKTLPRQLWPLIRDRHATVSEVFNVLFGSDEAVKFALASNLAYYHGNPPKRMPFIGFAIPQASYLLGGGHYIRGGSQVLTDRPGGRDRARRGRGGEAKRQGGRAHAIVVEGGGVNVCGVRHYARGEHDLREDRAPVVFGNAAPGRYSRRCCPRTCVEEFFPPPMRVEVRRFRCGRLARIEPAGRPGSACAATRPSCCRRGCGRSAHCATAGHVLGEEAGTRLPPYVFVDYSRIDSGLNQAGPYLGSLCGTDRIENWKHLSAEAKQVRKTVWMERLVADLDREFPGFAASVILRWRRQTMAHHLNTPDGAVYGFAPEREGINPLTMTARTAIDGLWLASAYVFGGGFTGAMMGGAVAAREVIRATEGAMARSALARLVVDALRRCALKIVLGRYEFLDDL